MKFRLTVKNKDEMTERLRDCAYDPWIAGSSPTKGIAFFSCSLNCLDKRNGHETSWVPFSVKYWNGTSFFFLTSKVSFQREISKSLSPVYEWNLLQTYGALSDIFLIAISSIERDLLRVKYVKIQTSRASIMYVRMNRPSVLNCDVKFSI